MKFLNKNQLILIKIITLNLINKLVIKIFLIKILHLMKIYKDNFNAKKYLKKKMYLEDYKEYLKKKLL